jgi:hypothetical protein
MIGGSGEFVSLTPPERQRVIDVAIGQAARRIPMIAGALAPGTKEVQETHDCCGGIFRNFAKCTASLYSGCIPIAWFPAAVRPCPSPSNALNSKGNQNSGGLHLPPNKRSGGSTGRESG